MGRVTPATMVHHIVTIEERPDLRLVWENIMSLCLDCHGLKHSGEMQQLKGANETGYPTHPGHPWSLMK